MFVPSTPARAAPVRSPAPPMRIYTADPENDAEMLPLNLAMPVNPTPAVPVQRAVPSVPAPAPALPPTAVVDTPAPRPAPRAQLREEPTPMPNPSNPPENRTIIAAGCTIVGDLESKDLLYVVVNGSLTGCIKATHVEIMEDGSVDGSIIAETVSIAGSFEGQLEAKKCAIKSTASLGAKKRVILKVEMSGLKVEEPELFHVEVAMGALAAAAVDAPKASAAASTEPIEAPAPASVGE